MTTSYTREPARRVPLRLWPGVTAVAVQWLVRFAVPLVVPAAGLLGVAGGFVGGLAVGVWWMFFSRAPWVERVGVPVLMVIALFATSYVADESIATGMMGMMLVILAIPVLSLALVTWAIASRRLADGPRRAWLGVAIVLACGVFTLLRTDGITGDGEVQLAWRWTPSPEERLLAQAAEAPVARSTEPAAAGLPGPPTPEPGHEPTPGPSAPEPVTPQPESHELDRADGAGDPPDLPSARAAWPGFRGPDRDGSVRGVRIETDWSSSPPVALWRRAVGPGWSSFAVRGDLLYTQEQRGDEEIVACYRVTSGEPVWQHRDPVRFWESNGGAGPRATPTISHDRVYTLGATGVVNALDARDGRVVWSRHAASDTGAKLPGWGFAGSPLVVDDVVVVAASGRLVAYDVARGEPRWLGPSDRGGSYSSPHRSTFGGVPQILLLSGAGLASVSPATGVVLWEHAWAGDTIVQPALTADGDLLISTGSAMGGVGARRLAVARGPEGWTIHERWTSAGLKPYFNDLVVHKGHAFGFDGSILASISLEDGTRNWKGGRYGHGQLMLLPDQDLLLVLSEDGELAVVGATPDRFRELARVPAIDGKTWNHPVLVGDVLLVRNGEEMAAFRIALARP